MSKLQFCLALNKCIKAHYLNEACKDILIDINDVLLSLSKSPPFNNSSEVVGGVLGFAICTVMLRPDI